MKKNDPISKIMATDIITVHVGQKPSDVRKILAENSFHHIPVVNGDSLVGIISASDMLRLTMSAYGSDPRSVDAMLDHTFKIEEIMVTEVKTVSATGTVRDAVSLLSEGSYHAVPVVGEDSKLMGMVTSTDLIRYLLNQY